MKHTLNPETETDTKVGAPISLAKVAAFRLAAIIEYSNDAVVSKTVDGIVIGWNHGAERLYGYLAEEMIGRPIAILFPPGHYEEYRHIMKEVVAGKSVPAFDTSRRRKDGTLVDVSVSITPIEALDGEVIGASKNSHDIIRIKKLETQFIEAQKMEVIGHLASGVAHDFNNILSVIIGYGELLTAQLAQDNPLQKYTEQIQHAAERATALTRQLLVFSCKHQVQATVLDLNRVISDMAKMLRRLVGENLSLKIDLGERIGRIKADSGHIGQVLMNLVINAHDAMPSGGDLTVTTGNATLNEGDAAIHKGLISGNFVVLSVKDTGVGMTAEVKKRLFEAFFTTKPKGKGTGLGLATCATIVKQCGGHIVVETELGKGTTFNVYFPQVELALDVPVCSVQTEPLARGTETLLIVEDEPAVRQLACSILKAQGYDVLSASNGQEALRVVKEHTSSTIRLVVTDVIMPLMGGEVMAEWIKTAYPDIKILFTSGYSDAALDRHANLDQGFEFLAKPYVPATLVRKVRGMLDNASDTTLLRKQSETRN
jgi:two-component system cell cycle sensor histidine kinase/response regulator CckA